MNWVVEQFQGQWRRLHGEGVPPCWRFAILTPRFRASGHVVFLFFSERGQAPEVVLKVGRSQAQGERLKREAENLLRLGRWCPALRGEGFPRLLWCDPDSSPPMLAQSGLPGHRLGRALVRRRPERYLEMGLNWILDLHCSRNEDLKAPVQRRLVLEPLKLLQERGLIRGEGAEMLEATRFLVGPLLERPLPAVVEHGDLSHPNLLVGREGRLGVVDWEAARLPGLPALDLFFFLSYVAFARCRCRRINQYVGAFKEAFFGPRAWAGPWVARYGEAVGLEPERLRPLFVLCWAHYCSSLAGRALAGTDSPEEVRDWLSRNRYWHLWKYSLDHLNQLNLGEPRAS